MLLYDNFGYIETMSKEFEDKLQDHKIKPTTMRLLVFRELVESGASLSLSDLEDRFEKADRVTLYRTLKTFEENKLIHSIDDGTGAMKYAVCEEGCECDPHDQHVHFHCVKCGETYCLKNTLIPEIQIPSGFSAHSVNMVFKGVCANCS